MFPRKTELIIYSSKILLNLKRNKTPKISRLKTA